MLSTRVKSARAVAAFSAARAVRSIQTFDALDSQVNILKNGKAIMSQGSGGRSSRSGYTVTVFGAPGFVGTQLVQRLAKHGTIVTAPFREEIFKRHLKPTGDLGVVNFQEFDLRNLRSIEDSVRSSDVVVNLVGRNWFTKNFSFEDVHVEGARRIAQATKDAGVPRFIHVSSHSADVNSTSDFYRTKALGEEAVKEIYPEATIVRPGPVYGVQDQFINYMAYHDFTLTASGGKEQIKPTYLLDLSKALEMMVYNDDTAGKLYELNGNETLTVAEIHEMIKKSVKRDIKLLHLPKPILKGITTFLQYAAYWEGVITPDVVERQLINQIENPDALGYSDLGITPQKLEDHIRRLTYWHRPNYYQRDSEETDGRRRKEDESWSNIVG